MYVYIYFFFLLTVIFRLFLACKWLCLLQSKQEAEEFHTHGTLGRRQWKTQIMCMTGLNIVRATYFGALELSRTISDSVGGCC